jgi:hypothetical protein
MKRRQPTAFTGMPEDQHLLGFCHLYLKAPDLFEPERDELLRTLATWFVANIPRRRLTNPELAALVDSFTPMSKSTTAARTLVAQLQRRTVKNVERAHQRYGAPIDQLRARRKAWLEKVSKREKQFDATELPNKKK